MCNLGNKLISMSYEMIPKLQRPNDNPKTFRSNVDEIIIIGRKR